MMRLPCTAAATAFRSWPHVPLAAVPTCSLTARRSILTTAMSSDELKADAEKNPFLIGTPFAAAGLAEPADAAVDTTGNGNGSGSGNGNGNGNGNGSVNGKRYSVLPHRTNLTSRLWLDRFDRNNSEYKKLVDATGTHPEVAHRPRHLVLKHMKDSYIEGELPFKSNPHVREEYVNFYGSIRIAKLLEDLDAMAGSISYTHCDDNTPETPPLTIVTASVDRIDLLKRPSLEQDTKVSGMVTYVGHSSMEITITVEEVNDEGESLDPILKARFTMVARDPITNQSVQVNPLVLENDAERRLFAMGAELKARKKLAASQALTKAPPTPEERLVIHDLWLQSKKYAEAPTLPASMAWMSDSKMQSVVITQPQDRNIHNFIFGGYLMRQAFEVAYTTASMFGRGHPVFLAMDDIWFRKPVPIGSILRFDSRVVYSRAPTNSSFQVMVTAEVLDHKTGSRDTTNVFHYTFALDKTKNNHQLPQVLPRTYEESMNYLEGKRKWELGLEMAKENHSKLLNLW